MKIYIDLVFIINYIFDFIVLLSTSIILKRRNNIFRIILGSLFGSLTIFILFIRFNTISLFLYKIIISIIMVIITFGFKDIKYFFNNIYYLYMISIILGGIIYFYNNQIKSNQGLLFISSYKYNLFFGIILSIVGIYIYIKNIKILKNNYNKYLKVILYINKREITLNAFLDTGNKLIDPYTFKPIILVNRELINNNNKVLLVPYKTCNNNGLLECIKIDKIYIDGYGFRKNCLIGLTDPIKIDDIDCILNERILEG